MSEPTTKDALKKSAYVFLPIILILAIFKACEVQQTQCFDIAESEAKEWIESVLKSKNERSSDGLILFDYSYDDVAYSHYESDITEKGNGFNSVDLFYKSNKTGEPLFKVSIFEDCDIHWMDQSK